MDPLPHPRRRSPLGVTVAELVSLHSVRTLAGAADPTAAPVSVAALLRREGRGPHAADRPLQPRTRTRPDPGRLPGPRHGVRRAAVAAGVLFAASAVFGASVLDESLSDPDREAADAFAVPEPDGSGDGATPADRGVGLATALAPLPEDGGAATGALPIASGADIGNDVLAGLLGTDPAAGVPGASIPAGDPPQAGGPPAAGSPVGGSPGGSAPGAPGAEQPGSGSPGAGTPGAGDPGGGPGPSITVPLPDLGTPDVTTAPLGAPEVAVGEAAIDAPDLTLTAGDDGLTLSASRAAVTTPSLSVGDVDAGPVALAGTEASLPDLVVESTAPLLAVGAGPQVTVPALTVSGAELPGVERGGPAIALPEPRSPEPAVPVVQTLTGVLGG